MPTIYKCFIIVALIYSMISAGVYVYSSAKERKEQKFTEVIINNKPFRIVDSF